MGKQHQDSSSVGHIQEAGSREEQGAWAMEVFEERREEDLL
jgi:hypothetical protein